MKKVSGHNIHDNTPVDTSSPTGNQTHNMIGESSPVQYSSNLSHGGLSELQKYTTNVLSKASLWGFANSNLKVKRHKLDNQTWQLTVVNPKTSKTILQAEGPGDTVFAHEDNLARMAETLMAQGLTIRTNFTD